MNVRAVLYVTDFQSKCPDCQTELTVASDEALLEAGEGCYLSVCQGCGRAVAILSEDVILQNELRAALPLEIGF